MATSKSDEDGRPQEPEGGATATASPEPLSLSMHQVEEPGQLLTTSWSKSVEDGKAQEPEGGATVAAKTGLPPGLLFVINAPGRGVVRSNSGSVVINVPGRGARSAVGDHMEQVG